VLWSSVLSLDELVLWSVLSVDELVLWSVLSVDELVLWSVEELVLSVLWSSVLSLDELVLWSVLSVDELELVLSDELEGGCSDQVPLHLPSFQTASPFGVQFFPG